MSFSISSRNFRTHILTIDGEDGDDIELELSHEPAYLNSDPLVEKVGDAIVVAYLSPDRDSPNPLEDCDGYGHLHHHPRSGYRSKGHDDYYDILGLGRYGDHIIDEDKVQDIWSAKIKALPDSVFDFPPNFEDIAWTVIDKVGNIRTYQQDLKDALADEEAGDYSLWVQCNYAWSSHELPEELMEALVDKISEVLDWNYSAVSEDCRKPWQQDAVLIDLYEHSGCHWSIHGQGYNCQWDTSGGAAVWVPDDCAKQEIDRRAETYNYAYIKATSYTQGQNMAYALHIQGCPNPVLSDDWTKLYKHAEEMARLKRKAGEPPKFAGREKAAEEICQQALDQYNAWCSGDVYGCVVEVFKANDEGHWESHEEDSCWGFITQEWAVEALKSDFFNPTVAKLQQQLAVA